MSTEPLNEVVSLMSDKLQSEFEKLLYLKTEQKNKSWISRKWDWVLLKSGLVRKVQSQKNVIREQLKVFESQVLQDIDLEKSSAFAEKLRSIRHDLRSPLTALQSIEDVLKNDELAAKTLNYAIKKIRILIEDLNEIDSKKEALKFSILEEIIQNSIFSFASKIKGKGGLRFNCVFDHKNLSPVMIARDTFQKVVTNLLDNALEAVGASGSIQLLVKGDAGTCQLIIEDDGCGIDPATLPKLFDKGASFGKMNGMGLSLYSAKKIIEEWDGKIEIEPRAKGTRFIINLPKIQTGVQFVGPGYIKDAVAIDDDPTIILGMRMVGINLHKAVHTYADGVRVLNEASTQRMTAIVDYRLGGGQLGTDLIAAHGRRSDCVLCTNDFDTPHLISEARHLGVRLMPKPLLFMWMPPVPEVKGSTDMDQGALISETSGLQV